MLGNRRRCLSPYYAAAELLWYLSREGSTRMIEAYAPQYSQFREEDGEAYGAYGKRLRGRGDDLLWGACEILREAPDSRQCVVPFWTAEDQAHAAKLDKRDIPCTVSWQFLARDGQLHMVVNMRSNDVWLGMPYDVYCFTQVQRLVAAHCGLQVGWYQHQAGSLHLYDRNGAGASEALAIGQRKDWPIGPGSGELVSPFHALDECFAAVRLETLVRLGPDVAEVEPTMEKLSPAMQEVVATTWWRWGRHVEHYLSDTTKEAIRCYSSKAQTA